MFLIFLIVPDRPSGQCAVYYRNNSIDERVNRRHDAVLASQIYDSMALSTWSGVVVHVWVLSTWEAEAEGNRVRCQPVLHTETFHMPFFPVPGVVLSVTSRTLDTSLSVSILRFSHLENISDSVSLVSLLPEFKIMSVKPMKDGSRQ